MSKLNMLLKETVLSRNIFHYDTQAYIDERNISLTESNLRKKHFFEACNNNVTNLHALYDAYSLSLRKMTKELKIHRKDTKSYKIRMDIDIHLADIFEMIEDNRDNFCDLVMINFEKDLATQELEKYAGFLKPVTQVWTDITKRCTTCPIDYKQTQNEKPFNFDLNTYMGHFVKRNQNGTEKLRIPIRVRILYINKLMTVFEKLVIYYTRVKNLVSIREQ